MITGFARFPDATTRPIASVDDVSVAWSDPDAVIWIDLEEPAEADLRAVGRLARLDGESIEDCLHGEQRPRIDEFEDYIFVVAYGLLGPEHDELDPRKLAAFCGKRFLITVHREPLRTVHGVLERCARNTGPVLAAGVDSVLYHIIDGMTDKYVLVADQYEQRIEALENRSLNPDVDDGVLALAAELRSEILQIRILSTSLRELVTPIAKGEYAYVSEALEQRFSHVRDHLSQMIESIDALREQLAGVRDNYHTALAGRTNAIMRTLTVFASIMLPLTLIAGIYGMNLRLWPPPEHPLSFWGVIAMMLATTVGLLIYFGRKKWL